jgi:hypothetical protein
MANPLDRASFVELLETRHREVSERKYKDLPSVISKLYRMLPSDSAWESFYNVGSVPDIPLFNGALTSLGISPGYYTKIEPKQFAGQIINERTLMDDKKYPVFDRIAEGLTESAHRVREKYAVRPIGYAFSTAFDFMESEEGVALCSSSHTTKSGTSTSSGFDNAGTSAMSKTSIAATRIIMKQFRNDISERIDTDDSFAIICPDELEETAYEIVKTPAGYDTVGKDVNFQYGKYEIIPISRLSDIDSNNWFMALKSRMKNDLVFIDRVTPEYKTTVDWATYAIMQAIYMRIAAGWLDWRWIYGHEVS